MAGVSIETQKEFNQNVVKMLRDLFLMFEQPQSELASVDFVKRILAVDWFANQPESGADAPLSVTEG